ncbi:MAG TPA: YggS family pyridoxal phosphate-dependent enzyme [Burkholderiales bacterium]|nr:YggS family pyridoxal phosphate-dependent enzyme [Burkholderiales bacterium]
MTTITARLQAICNRIRAAAEAAGRPPEGVRLVAVSKTFPLDAILEALAAGQADFGENYVQEAEGKISALAKTRDAARSTSGVASPKGPLLRPPVWDIADEHRNGDERRGDVSPTSGVASPKGPLLRPPVWHFIGPIQSNKTRPIAELFDWVHSVDRVKIAERLSAARPPGLAPLQVCIQVNVSAEASKSGVPPGEAAALARAIAGLPGIRLRGLMAIPEPAGDPGLLRARFRRVRELKEEIAAGGIALDTLSMGMSDDLEAAIAEGATLVRVGRAIFGDRPARAG